MRQEDFKHNPILCCILDISLMRLSMNPKRHLDSGAAVAFSEPDHDLIGTLPSHAPVEAANSEPRLDAVQIKDLSYAYIETGAPWQSREELQKEADLENRARKAHEQEQTGRELIRLQKEEALAAAGKYENNMASMRKTQAIELRRREVALQNQMDALRPWNILQKGELNKQLAIVTERLNGLTQSTPDMRHRERQAATVQAVRETIPGRTVRQPEEHRPTHIQARDNMHADARKRDDIGFFGRLFGKKKMNIARGKALGSSARYGQELRKGHGEVAISQQELDDLNDQLDNVA